MASKPEGGAYRGFKNRDSPHARVSTTDPAGRSGKKKNSPLSKGTRLPKYDFWVDLDLDNLLHRHYP